MEHIHKKLDTLTIQIRDLAREVQSQKILFVRGMKSVKRAFEMVRKIINSLADNVEDFNELSGVLVDF